MSLKRSSTESSPTSKETPAALYIRDNYRPVDRVAAVAVNRKTRRSVERIAPAENIAAEDGQDWLRHMNENGYEIYLSANALKGEARSRTREDIEAIRHICLDVADGGDQPLDRLLMRSGLPRPSYILTTSPREYQLIWKVEGFQSKQAEALQGHLARDAGADGAATDSARLLRLPGFHNRRCDPPHLVAAREMSNETYTLESFSGLGQS